MVVACTKASDTSEARCPALRVTVDGGPVPAMPYGLAYSYRVNGEVTWQVDLSNLETTCKHYMGEDGRILRGGEETVRAFIGTVTGVGIANQSVPFEKVELVGAPPSKPGDKLTLCVTGASFTRELDAYKHETVVMNGKLEGTYCGAR